MDAAIRVQRELRNGMTLGVGYRGLEGGADIDELYTFAWLRDVVGGLAVPLA